MKKFILLFLLSIATASGIRAQLPDGAYRFGLTMTDLDGNVHHLPGLLGYKTVFIDMFIAVEPSLRPTNYIWNESGLRNRIRIPTPTNLHDIDCPSLRVIDNRRPLSATWLIVLQTNGGNFLSSYQLSYYPTIYGTAPMVKYHVGQRQLNLITFIGASSNSLHHCSEVIPKLT